MATLLKYNFSTKHSTYAHQPSFSSEILSLSTSYLQTNQISLLHIPKSWGNLSTAYAFSSGDKLKDFRNKIMPFSTLKAVRTIVRESPYSTMAIATAGCIPTTTVSPSKIRDMVAILLRMRPRKQSTISRE